MHTFFVSSQAVSGDSIALSEPGDVHHLKKVLRLRVGTGVRICDDQGNAYACILAELSPMVSLKIKKKMSSSLLKKVSLTVACAIPKKGSMDDIVDKLTQLGVDRIIPLVTQRVVVRMDASLRNAKLMRWRRKALAASQQAQRKTLPVIEPVATMQEVWEKTATCDMKLIPTLEGRRIPLRSVLENKSPKYILVFIGPEGDFSAAEVAAAIKHGCLPVSLGEQVLRVETAAVAVASYCMLYYENV